LSTTTKFRVVFDASAKTTNGKSLNDIMMVGPIIQDSLVNIIMKFRTHKIAMTADIEKMFRQVLIHPDDQEYQHIVWRESPDHPIRHFRLATVTYGTAAGTYLSVKVLHQLAQLEMNNYPIAAKALQKDFYVDDIMSGGSNVQDTLVLQKQLVDILSKAGMNIRKFTCNSKEVLDALPKDQIETKFMTFDKEEGIKALGIFWNPVEDYFGFHTNTDATNMQVKYTKRYILSEISKLFDPLGWLAPLVVTAKILMQTIWKEKIEWDEEVPDHIKRQWEEFNKDLRNLKDLKIPRAQSFNPTKSKLAGFSDSSEDAYSASIYLCTYEDNNEPTVSLVTAKTRVAPLKKQSLPRLELCGALLTTDLMQTVRDNFNLGNDSSNTCIYIHTNNESMAAFTDSTLVLDWLKAEPYQYKNFVGNRMAKIQDVIPYSRWGYVKSSENPADCASRGISCQELINHPLWWTGPQWLQNEKTAVIIHPQHNPSNAELLLMEARATPCHVTLDKIPREIFLKFSSLGKMQRVIAYVLRFINNTKELIKHGKNATLNKEQWITSQEMNKSLQRLIIIAQQQEFATEIQTLKDKKSLPKGSKILSLDPFIDNLNILRVGGRLRHAKIPEDQKHPILLPQHHRLTNLIVRQAHIANLHANSQTLLSYLQQKYWIIRGKDIVKRQVRTCIICTRHRAEVMQQKMADLPEYRVCPSQPFNHTGIDYAGPILTRPINRSKITTKAYIAIFICCVTKAIHLEIVSDASTKQFIAALRRFIARRGKPTHIYSDNGTNFVGANNEIKELEELVKSTNHNQEIASTMASDGITWHFNPPAAPHFGGLWEAGVKSTKYHLRRVMGSTRLTFEELATLTSQIEAILNSRPLTAETTDPSELRALTPGHFLIGQALTTIPDPNLLDLPINRLSRWQSIQQMAQSFWKRWSSEYITRLQNRPKWMSTHASITEGALVIIKDDNSAPLHWKLGRVTKTHPGADGIVRTVTLKVNIGDLKTDELKRPIVKVCLLPNESIDEEIIKPKMKSIKTKSKNT
jgi:hypothetical protein